ncbi:hypothetical protein MP228_000689 [Amoeboaphelidium protococcarum]|nr:hypothetical protein MP228_000689 [Amoeboaphelidium protococcarum]
MWTSIKSWSLFLIKYGFSIAAVLVAAFAAALYANQRKIVYPSYMPEGSRQFIDLPSQYGLDDFEDVNFQSADGTKLHAYYIKHPSKAAKSVMLFCHANAGNMGHRLPIVKKIMSELNVDVFIFSYRGYGKSEGQPDEKGIKEDAVAAMEYVQQRTLESKLPITIFGQSIGGAVAIYLASKYPQIKMLIIENTFLNIPLLVPKVFPVLKYFSFLCSEIWANDQIIQTLDENIPLLFLSSTGDELIPVEHQQKLFSLAPCKIKQMVNINGSGHNDAPLKPEYWESFFQFYKRVFQQ